MLRLGGEKKEWRRKVVATRKKRRQDAGATNGKIIATQ